MDARIGQVVRNGNTVFYAFIGGRELANLVESSNMADIAATLEGKALAAPKAAKKEYTVMVTKKFPAWDEVEGYTMTIWAVNAAEACQLARAKNKKQCMFSRAEGGVRYTAKRA